MQKLFEYLFHIRASEFNLVQAFFLFYVCLGMFIVVGITAGDALLLTHVSSENVSMLYAWVHIGVGLVAIAVTGTYNRIVTHLSRLALLVGVQGGIALSILVFRYVLSSGGLGGNEWQYFAFIIWIRACSHFVIMLFFSFAGDYFTVHDARRLYPYLAGGMPTGILIAGALIQMVAPLIGPLNLLYGCIGLLLAGIGCTLWLYHAGRPVTFRPKKTPKRGIPVQEIVSQSYLRLIFLAALIGMICFVLVDFQMKISARAVYQTSMALTGFFGQYYSWVGIVEVVFQFVAVKFLLRRLGIMTCLLILPGIHLGMSLLFYASGQGALARHALLLIVIASFSQEVLVDSLDLPSRELVFLPLSFHVRVRAQAMMKGMIEPLGQVMGGVAILVGSWGGISLFQYSLPVLIFALLRLLILLKERAEYRKTLASSLKADQLGPANLSKMLQSSERDELVHEFLQKNDEQMLSFMLDLLREQPPGELTPQIRQLSLHAKPELAVKAITLLGADGDTAHLATLERTIHAEFAAIRQAGVIAWCQIKGEAALPRIAEWMASSDAAIKFGAMIGGGRYGGRRGRTFIRPVLKRLAASPSLEDRLRAAELFGAIHHPAYIPLLDPLLDDPDVSVRITAIQSCRAIRSLALVPHLLRLYHDPELRVPVVDALQQMPETSVQTISEFLYSLHFDDSAHEPLFQVLAFIGGHAAQRVLWEFFCGDFPVIARVAAGNALRQLTMNAPLDDIDAHEFDTQLDVLSARIDILNRCVREIGETNDLVWRLLKDQARLEIECLFQLLTFHYPNRGIEKIRYNFFQASAIQRANALELLEEILPRRITMMIMRLLDHFMAGKYPAGFGLSEQSLQFLLCAEPWMKAVAHYAQLPSAPLSWQEKGAGEEALSWRPLLERMSYLKSIPLFRDVPGNSLIPLARIVTWRTLHAGETLFQQGERGDAMYLIQDGCIGILIHGKEINQLGTGESLGEMAILDGSPRSPACIAKKDTHLLKIAAADFEMILKSQPSVVIAILQILAARLRQQTLNTIRSQDTLPVKKLLSAGRLFDRKGVMPVTERKRRLHTLLERMVALQMSPLFHDVSEAYRVQLAHIVRQVKLQPGETLFYQGEEGRAMYVICRGLISLQVNEIEVVRLGKHECLGELSLLENTPRLASCVALEESDLLKICDTDVEIILKSQPSVAFAILRTLVGRLRQQTARGVR